MAPCVQLQVVNHLFAKAHKPVIMWYVSLEGRYGQTTQSRRVFWLNVFVVSYTRFASDFPRSIRATVGTFSSSDYLHYVGYNLNQHRYEPVILYHSIMLWQSELYNNTVIWYSAMSIMKDQVEEGGNRPEQRPCPINLCHGTSCKTSNNAILRSQAHLSFISVCVFWAEAVMWDLIWWWALSWNKSHCCIVRPMGKLDSTVQWKSITVQGGL